VTEGRVRPVVTAPAGVLSTVGAEVDPTSPEVVQLAADLVATMRVAPGCVGLAANQIGEHPAGMRSGGRSMIIDPWGLVLAQAPDEPTHIVAELDLERQREIRSALPSLANRRDDAYLWPQEVRA